MSTEELPRRSVVMLVCDLLLLPGGFLLLALSHSYYLLAVFLSGKCHFGNAAFHTHTHTMPCSSEC